MNDWFRLVAFSPFASSQLTTSTDGTNITTYDGDGLRRTVHEPGQSVKTMIWDGSDYLIEIQ